MSKSKIRDKALLCSAPIEAGVSKILDKVLGEIVQFVVDIGSPNMILYAHY